MILAKKNNTTELFGLGFFNQSKKKLNDLYISIVIKKHQPKRTQPFLIFTPNPEQIVLAKENPAFNAALQEADILIPDGVGIVLASKVLGSFKNLPLIHQRITGVDLAQEVLDTFLAVSCVVIGGRAESSKSSASSAEQVLTYHLRKIPWLPGYQDIQHPTAAEEQVVVKFLKKYRPTVVLVAFGAPYQEFWSLRHRALLQQNGVKLVVVVGGTVDLLSGKLHRAPKILQRLGLEWVFRLLQEPWRWKRQLRLIKFVQLTLRQIM